MLDSACDSDTIAIHRSDWNRHFVSNIKGKWMPLQTRCPNPDCNKSYDVADEHVGRRAQCKKCGSTFRIRVGVGELVTGGSPPATAASAVSGSAKQGVASASVGNSPSADRPTGDDGVPVTWNLGDLILDLYEVTGVLGEGGMGRVYKVRHKGWNTDLAVKSPLPKLLRSPGAVENFERECETWIDLGLHPHAVSCFYVRRLGGIPRVFAEYVDGGSLKDWIDDGRLYEGGSEKALERILDIAIQFAWGLHYAHEKGLIHQDVKPANVMMTTDGTAKVTDFGLAKARAVAGEVSPSTKGQSILVSSGGMTPAYCSPEQANGEKLSRKTDLWSWAVSVLEMFTGDVTWPSGTVAPEALEGYLEMGSGDERITRMPDAVSELLRHCFCPQPDERPDNLRVISQHLRGAYHAAIGHDYPRPEPKPAELLADQLNNRAISMLDLGRLSETERLLEETLSLDAYHLAGTYNRGLLLWRDGQMTDLSLLTQLEEMGRSHPDCPNVHQVQGLVHLERADFESAVKVLREAMRFGGAIETERHLTQAETLLSRQSGCLRIFKGHSDSVLSVYMSADGRYALSGGRDKILLLWEVSTGKCLRKFNGHYQAVTSVYASVNNQHALSGSEDGTVRLWELSTGRCLQVFEGHTERVSSVCLSANGQHVLSGSEDGTVRLWEISTGRCLLTYQGHNSTVESVSISADHRYGLSGSGDNTLHLWELSTGRCVQKYEGHNDLVNSVWLSADGQHGLSGSWDDTIRLWQLSTGRCLRIFNGHARLAQNIISEARGVTVCLSTDGRLALSGSWDKTIRLWEVRTGQCLRTFEGHTDWVTSISLGADGRLALSGSRDGTVRLWNIEALADPARAVAERLICRVVTTNDLTTTSSLVSSLLNSAQASASLGDWQQTLVLLRQARAQPGHRMHSGARKLLQVAGRRSVRATFDMGLCVHANMEHTSSARSVCLSADGQYAISGCDDDGTIRLWELATGRCLRTFKGHREDVLSVCFSKDGKYVLSGSQDKDVRVWETSSGRCVRILSGHTDAVESVCVSADGLFALSGSRDNTLRLWALSTGRYLRTLKGHVNNVNAVCMSPDGRYALSGSGEVFEGTEDNTIRLWELATSRCLQTFTGHASKVESVCFSSDCRYALSGSWDHTLRLWEVATGSCLRIFKGHISQVFSVAISADGRHALSGSADKTVRLWEVSTGRCLRTYEGHTEWVESVCLSTDGRYAISGSWDHTLRLWELDWEYEFPGWADWDEGARPYLETFLTLCTPYAAALSSDHQPTEEEIQQALTRRGRPIWTDADVQQLLTELEDRGFGWLRPEGVRRKLEEMTASWTGPPPLVRPT